ncbi:MAG: four helix bundle protein [Anaerolineales bacterium]|nr:four helix bundle protein [Anaerolineales bacterium]
MGETGLEKLHVWQMAKELVVFIYKDVDAILPDEEKWGLPAQIRRAVISVPANIAEGYGRYYFQESIRFCYNARGSIDGLYTHNHRARPGFYT